jgi:hypothetical protein
VDVQRLSGGGHPLPHGDEPHHAGTYALRYIARKPERHTGFWHGAGNSVDQTSQVTYFVRHNDIATIDP